MAIKPKTVPLSPEVKAFIDNLKNPAKATNNKSIKNEKSVNNETNEFLDKPPVIVIDKQDDSLEKILDKATDKVSDNNLAPDWFTEANLKETASDLEAIITSEGYDYQADPEGVYCDEAGRCYCGIKKIDSKSDWEIKAKVALQAFRETIPLEVFQASLNYLPAETSHKINQWVLEANEHPMLSDNLPDNSVLVTDNKTEYRYITDNESLKQEIAFLNDEKLLGIDTETTGLDPHLNKLRLIQIATPNNPVLVIDCFKCDPKLIQPLLLNDAIKVFHNAKFDLQFFLKLGLEINQKLFDTQLAYQLLTAGKDVNNSASLKSLALKYLGVTLDKVEQVSDWANDTLSDTQLQYSAKDAEILLPLREKLRERIVSAKLTRVAKIEFDCVLAVAMMELNGMLLDLTQWKKIRVEAERKKADLEIELHKILKIPSAQLELLESANNIDLDSPKQVKEALNYLGINVENTSFKSLAKLAPDYEVIRLLLEYRKVSKLISSFGEALPNHVNSITGRLHSQYWQCGSAAGRFSCSTPNLQQIPRSKEVRGCFVATPGNMLVIADYSQIELRIVAEIAGDHTMLEAYSKDEDLHKLTASLILNKSIDEITKEDRQIAKSANFGLIYGAGGSGFRSYAENNYGIKLSEAKAKKIRDNFFKAYSGLVKWHKRTKSMLYNGGISETRTLSARRRLFKEASPQQALNTPVQGTGADLLKLALAKLPVALKGTNAKILATIHDEIILEASTESADNIADILSDTMVEAGREFLTKVPVIAEASVGDSWADK